MAAREDSVFLAVEQGDLEVLQRLLKLDPELAKTWRLATVATPLHGCLGKPALALLLIEHGADVNAIDCDERRLAPLHLCAQHGDLGMVHLLLAHGADPNARSHIGTALHCAVTGVKGKLPSTFAEVVKVLMAANAELDAFVDPDTDAWTALHQACNEGFLPAVELLLELGATVGLGKDGVTPLFVAEGNGFKDIAAKLRAAGAR